MHYKVIQSEWVILNILQVNLTTGSNVNCTKHWKTFKLYQTQFDCVKNQMKYQNVCMKRNHKNMQQTLTLYVVHKRNNSKFNVDILSLQQAGLLACSIFTTPCQRSCGRWGIACCAFINRYNHFCVFRISATEWTGKISKQSLAWRNITFVSNQLQYFIVASVEWSLFLVVDWKSELCRGGCRKRKIKVEEKCYLYESFSIVNF